jgi:hypothetical protein
MVAEPFAKGRKFGRRKLFYLSRDFFNFIHSLLSYQNHDVLQELMPQTFYGRDEKKMIYDW